MTKPSRPVRFLFTRVATAGSAVGAFISLWAGVAATAPRPANDTETAQPDTAAETVIEQDGWRWDPAANEWVAIDPLPEPAAEAASPEEQVIVVERQPVVYRYNYVYVPADSPAASGAAGAPPSGQAQAPASPQPAAAPPEQAAPTIDVVQEQPVYQPPVEEQPALPPPAPAAPPAAAPPPAAPPPKPAPTQAPKSTKGS